MKKRILCTLIFSLLVLTACSSETPNTTPDEITPTAIVETQAEETVRETIAPTNGDMNRTIHESASCKAHYRFSHKNEVLCDFISKKASFEFEYFDGDNNLKTS